MQDGEISAIELHNVLQVVENLANSRLIRYDESQKNSKLICSFFPKHIMFQLENFKGITCHDTKGGANLKGKLTCGLKRYIRNLVKFRASS